MPSLSNLISSFSPCCLLSSKLYSQWHFKISHQNDGREPKISENKKNKKKWQNKERKIIKVYFYHFEFIHSTSISGKCWSSCSPAYVTRNEHDILYLLHIHAQTLLPDSNFNRRDEWWIYNTLFACHKHSCGQTSTCCRLSFSSCIRCVVYMRPLLLISQNSIVLLNLKALLFFGSHSICLPVSHLVVGRKKHETAESFSHKISW